MSDKNIEGMSLDDMQNATRNVSYHTKFDSEGRFLVGVTNYTVPLNGISVKIQNHESKELELTDVEFEFILNLFT